MLDDMLIWVESVASLVVVVVAVEPEAVPDVVEPASPSSSLVQARGRLPRDRRKARPR